MKTLTLKEVYDALRLHAKWLNDETGGVQAVFKDVRIENADTMGLNLACVHVENMHMENVHLDNVTMRHGCVIDTHLTDGGATRVTLENVRMTRLVVTNVTFDGVPLPAVPNIDKAILNLIEENPSSFDMSVWHSECGTAHCRAGFAVKLAGEAGAELERLIGTANAATLIYGASRPGIPIPDFFTSRASALADLKDCAEKYSK